MSRMECQSRTGLWKWALHLWLYSSQLPIPVPTVCDYTFLVWFRPNIDLILNYLINHWWLNSFNLSSKCSLNRNSKYSCSLDENIHSIQTERFIQSLIKVFMQYKLKIFIQYLIKIFIQSKLKIFIQSLINVFMQY